MTGSHFVGDQYGSFRPSLVIDTRVRVEVKTKGERAWVLGRSGVRTLRTRVTSPGVDRNGSPSTGTTTAPTVSEGRRVASAGADRRCVPTGPTGSGGGFGEGKGPLGCRWDTGSFLF